MKKRCGVIIVMILYVILLSACENKTDRGEKSAPEESMTKSVNETELTENAAETGGAQMDTMTIEVGGQKFQATLYENDTVRALVERFPMTLNMEELHGNEKFYYLDEGLPTKAQDVGTIKTGDIMLFGSDCLVLFFKDFDTSYSYTKIGHIDDTRRFTESLESGTVEVSFSTGE